MGPEGRRVRFSGEGSDQELVVGGVSVLFVSWVARAVRQQKMIEVAIASMGRRYVASFGIAKSRAELCDVLGVLGVWGW